MTQPVTTTITTTTNNKAASNVWWWVTHRAQGRLPVPWYDYRPSAANSVVFRNAVASWHYQQENFKILESPQIISPYQNAITSLDLDKREERFLLVGGADATLSIFDLSSPWGSDEEQQRRQQQHHQHSIHRDGNNVARHYRPIARSNRASNTVTTNATSTGSRSRRRTEDVPPSTISTLAVPAGHAADIIRAQWYRVDPGACVSASVDGALLVWDTQFLTPVIQWKPFSGGCSCMDLSPCVGGRSESLLAMGSYQEDMIKLVDVRSGAASHSLHGHSGGVAVVQWASTTDVVLASGGQDGTIRLWDIRKSGSRSCLTILDRDATSPTTATTTTTTKGPILSIRPYSPEYNHLQRPHERNKPNSGAKTSIIPQQKFKKLKRQQISQVDENMAPNNYGSVEQAGTVSHGGPISALVFSPDGHGLVSTGRDGMMQVWDLRSGHAVAIRFFRTRHQQLPLLLDRRVRRISVAITPQTNTCTRIWLGYESQVVAYSMERGGAPLQVLEGHLGPVTALEPCHHTFQLLTAGQDGMILAWGKKHGHYKTNNNNTRSNSSSATASSRRRLVDDRDNW